MKERIAFRSQVNEVLRDMDSEVLAYDRSEYWMIRAPYEYIEYYAMENRLMNTAVALHLARGIHDGTYRKSSIVRNGATYRLPYVIHCLMVCRMLVDLKVDIPRKDEDVMLAAALCHDMIEDIDFPEEGKELYTQYHLDPRVYEIVKLLSKRRNFTEEEEQAFFRAIEKNPLALLVKLSDRSHNVEDLYNMSPWKVREYIWETRYFMLPMCSYGLEHYPEIFMALEILRDKIVSLTEAAEILVDRYEEREQELEDLVEELKEENRQLRMVLKQLWKG